MIVNLPGETEDDVIKDLELLDRIKRLRVVTFPLPFIPMGALRRTYFTLLDRMMLDPVRGEFILRALEKAFDEATRDMNLVVEKMENPFYKVVINWLGERLANTLVERYREALRELASRRLRPYEPQAEAALRISMVKP